MPTRSKPRASMVAIAMLLVCVSAAALAQSAPDATSTVASAVVSVGVVALEPNSGSSTLDSLANHPASIHGSGFFVDKMGHVITALHVVRAAERARDQMQGTDNRLMIGLRAGAGELGPQ